MGKKNLSVIIPVYNAEKYIGNLLKKLERQQRSDLEIILVDDGSKDNSLALCRSFAAQNDCFILYHQENQGASAARNQGIDLSSGDYIVFVDSDDDISDTFVETICDSCAKRPADIIQLDCYIRMARKTKLKPSDLLGGRVDPDEYCRFILQQKNNAPWDKIYKAEIIREHRVRFETGMVLGEDISFTLKFLEYAQSVRMVHEAIYFYQRNESGLVSNVTTAYFDDLDRLYCNMETLITRKGLDSGSRAAMEQSMFRSIVRAAGLCARNGCGRREIQAKIDGLDCIHPLMDIKYQDAQDRLRKVLLRLRCFGLISFLVGLKTK